MSKACLVDTTLCIGCRACQVACKAWNALPAEETAFRPTGASYEQPAAQSSETYTRITFHEFVDDTGALDRSVFVKHQCMHCLEPACVAACPVAALQTIEDGHHGAGAVVYESDKCMGCRYCMLACPFSVPKFEWHKRSPEICKCTFCADRLERDPADIELNGTPLPAESRDRLDRSERTPACAQVCPTEAIRFGDRGALIAEARRRIAEQNRKPDTWHYVDYIYGEREVGGTRWLYLASAPFDELGFRTDLGEHPYTEYTDAALARVPPAVVGVGAVLGGVYWVSRRRSEVEDEPVDGGG